MSIIIVKLQFSCVAFVIEFMLDHKECQEALGLTYYNRQIVDRAGIFEFKVAIKGTRTVRECGPHAHCADRTPHSKPKKVRTRTVSAHLNVLFKWQLTPKN